MSQKESDLVDEPKGFFYIKTTDELFFVIVMKKHKSNLSELNQKSLLSQDNKKTILKKLAEFVRKYGDDFCHGDIKAC